MLTPKKYKVRSGAIDLGKPYEVKITALISLKCCLENLEHFWLASNVDECGALDDVIVYKKEKSKAGITQLTQLKHQDKPRGVTKDQILANKGDFSLEKYLDSCIKLSNSLSNPSTKRSDIIDHLKSNPEMVFALYTNKDVAGKFDFLEPKISTDFMNINGNVYEFNGDKLNMGTLNDSRKEILSKILLYTKQPHIKDTDNEIKNVLKKIIDYTNKSEKETDEVVNKYTLFIENWSKGLLNGFYPLTKTHVLKKITEILLEPFMVKIDRCVKIEDEDTYKIWNDITKDRNVVINGSDGAVFEFIEKVTSKFVLEHEQLVRDCTTVKKDLLRNTEITDFSEIYEYSWKTRQIPLVIKVDSQNEIEEVSEILRISQDSFWTILLNNSKITLDDFKFPKTIFTVLDLDEEQQRELFKLPIKLQGRYLDCYHGLNVDVQEIYGLQIRDIIYILYKKFNIGQEFAKLPDVFVDISLKRVWLKIDALQEVINDIFVIQCEHVQDFRKLIETDLLDIDDSEIIDWKDKDSFNSSCHRLILHEHQNEINNIEEFLKRKCVHYLMFHKNIKLEWNKSTGTVRNIKSFRKRETFEEKRIMAVDAIRSFCTEMRSIVVSSNPGMGKSVFVNFFTRNAPVDFWVLKINLAKYKAHYKMFRNESKMEDSLKIFFEKILEDECKDNLFLVRAIFYKFYAKKNLVVLLDGFDEIPINYQSDAKQFIEYLSRSNFFVLVTTRPVLKNELETLLDTFSLDLNLFTRSDQEYFLQNYFSRNTEITCKAEEVLSFVKNLLDAAKDNLNDHDNEFTGVPLQTLLLAEVFIEDFKKFLGTQTFFNKHFDLLYLYKNFIEKKIKIACEKFGDISEDMINEYRICRTFYALRLLFSDEDLEELQISLKLKHGRSLFPNMLELIQKDGIVVAETESDIRFIHQTFAEYLTGEWLTENIKNENKTIAKNLLKLTFDPQLKVVRNIFDRILAGNNCPLHLAIINFQVEKVNDLLGHDHLDDLDRGGRNCLHLLASWGFHHPKQFRKEWMANLKKLIREDEMMEILNLIPDEELRNIKDQILEYSPLDYAIISSSLHIADALCARIIGIQISIDVNTSQQTFLLHYCDEIEYLSLNKAIISYISSSDSKLIIDLEDRNSLSYIISRANLKKLNLLISEGIDVNEKDQYGSTPLHIATRLEKEGIVNILIEKGANLNLTDNSGKTSLHWSAIYGNLNISKMLVSNGTDVNIIDNQERTALHYAIISCPKNQLEIMMELSKTNFEIIDINSMTPFLWAANYGYTQCVSLLLELGVDIEQKSSDEITALHWAASNGHINVVNLLLDKGAQINAKTWRDTTPLIFAAQYGHANIVDALLRKGADVQAKDVIGMSALYCAASQGHKRIVISLIEKKVDIETENDVSALCLASQHGHKDIVELLLDCGANIEGSNSQKKTSLHWAAFSGHKDIVKLLLAKGANINAEDLQGNTALVWAVRGSYTQVVKLLLAKGVKFETTCLHEAAEYGFGDIIHLFLLRGLDINLKDENGMTALHCSAKCGSRECVTLLLSKGADIESRNSNNETPLLLSAKHGRQEVTNLLLSEGANLETRGNQNETPLIVSTKFAKDEMINLLISKGANIKAKDDAGKNAFHWAACTAYSTSDTIELFLSKWPDVMESKTKKEQTPLILAATHGVKMVVELLLSRNANIEARDCDGMTSLHWASINGRKGIVYLLLQNSADPEVKDNDGKTALMFAAENGRKKVVKLLLLSEASTNVKDRNGLTALGWAKNNKHEDVVALLKSEKFYFDKKLVILVALLVLIVSWFLSYYIVK